MSVAQESGMVIVRGDSGFARIFDYHMGALRDKLEHGGGESFKAFLFL